MKNIKQQIYLFKKRSQIRTEINPIRFDKNARLYIKKIFLDHKKNITLLFAMVFAISIIEIIIPLLINVFLERFGFNLDINNLYFILTVLLVILISYIIVNYFAIAKQKKISLDIINKIREDWLKVYLDKSPLQFNDRDKGNLYVKMSYHLSLLQMGLNNSLFGFFQWIIYMVGILGVTALLDTRLLLISLAFIPINIIVFFIAYVFSAYYLAKDQTLYSKLLRYISDTFNSFQLIKALKKEKEFISNVRNIVELDNYFRIKREIVLSLGNKIIFVVVTLMSASMYLINIYVPFLSLGTTIASVVQVLIFALHLKLIYLSLRMGLFYFPLKLGLYLCTPKFSKTIPSKKINTIETLKFNAKKVKINEKKGYQKNISFIFEKGKRYLMHNPGGQHNNLPYVFAGTASKSSGQNWVVTANNQRLIYNQWNRAHTNIYMIHPYMYSEVSLYEFFDRELNLQLLKQFPVFDFIFEKKKFLGEAMNQERSSFTEVILLQIAHCIVHQPTLVVIDALIVDVNYVVIKQALDALSQHSKGTIISFSQLQKPIHNYDVIYTI